MVRGRNETVKDKVKEQADELGNRITNAYSKLEQS